MKIVDTPSPGAIAEAEKNPGGWVYAIGGNLNPDGAIPPDAVIGAWKVDNAGKITGAFIPNPNYNESKYP